jgi:hypothetical protein
MTAYQNAEQYILLHAMTFVYQERTCIISMVSKLFCSQNYYFLPLDDICKTQHQNNQHKKKGKVDSLVIWPFYDGKTEAPIQVTTDPTT